MQVKTLGFFLLLSICIMFPLAVSMFADFSPQPKPVTVTVSRPLPQFPSPFAYWGEPAERYTLVPPTEQLHVPFDASKLHIRRSKKQPHAAPPKLNRFNWCMLALSRLDEIMPPEGIVEVCGVTRVWV